MRSVTHEHVMRHLRNTDAILELNSGTGIDAEFFAKNGFRIHCTDVSDGMLTQLANKISEKNLSALISFEKLSYTDLSGIPPHSFNYIFSNFGGLNCAPDLVKVVSQFPTLLKPGGRLTLVMMPRICPWELALVLRGKIKTAFRRLHKNGVMANVEGVQFRTYYYSVNEVKLALGPKFRILDVQGLGSVSPPPYMEHFPERYPGIFGRLILLESKLSHFFPFNCWADHFIITAELCE